MQVWGGPTSPMGRLGTPKRKVTELTTTQETPSESSRWTTQRSINSEGEGDGSESSKGSLNIP